MREDDDYTLMDRDFDEFIKRGLAEKEWEARNERREISTSRF